MRRVCKRVRHASELPSTDRNEEMDWVATIGMQRHCRVRAKDFSSPEGSSSPTEANDWYSSQMNTAGRKYRPGDDFISAGRRRSACSQAFLSMTPIARASAGLVPAGMFRASTLPDSISSSRGGKL